MNAGPEPFSPGRLGPLELRNRLVKAATFEGMSPGGVATDALVAFHRTFAAGGVGMTTVAFCAVSPQGRNAPGQIVMRPEAVGSLRRLTDAVHAEGAAAAVQLGHAGPVAAAAGVRGLGPGRIFSPVAMRFTRAATRGDLERLVEAFADSASVAASAGFDAVELHFGHHYLVSSFLSPRWNRRSDAYGGSLENRARFAREIARAVRASVPSGMAVTAKLNMTDAVPGGLEPHESLGVARLLQSDGGIDALELTGGGSFANPMFLFRGGSPVRELSAQMPVHVRLGMRALAPWFMPSYPFEEAYFLDTARSFREALELPLILLGGINRLDTVRSALAAGFPFVAMARALLREPDLVNRMRDGEAAGGICDHSNRCMATIYGGTHCVLVAPEDRPGLALASG